MADTSAFGAGKHRTWQGAKHRLDVVRRSLKIPILLALVATLSASAVSAVSPGTAGAASAAHPILFGAGGSSRSMIQTNESIMGKKIQGARVYRTWSQAVFSNDQTWARDTGHTLFVSIKTTQGGRPIKWASIASAQPGSALYQQMVTQANQIKAFKATVYIALNHEPEADASRAMGSSAQFVAAWRRWVTVLRGQGVKNARFVFAATAYGFARKDSRNAASYYPGDAYVDGIAADGYNWGGCRGGDGWRNLADVIEAQRQFGLKHPSKPLMLWEWGSTEDPKKPGRKAQWLTDARALFKQAKYNQYTVLLTWEGRAHGSTHKCHFDYLSSTSAKNAWKAFGTDPAYRATSGG